MGEVILATYRLMGQTGRDAAASAAAFATGQSVGTWLPLPGLTPQLVERHGAHVVEMHDNLAAATADAVIAFPAHNFEAGFPMLWTTLLGNDPSTGINATLVDLELPRSVAQHFPGPRVGIASLRARFGFDDRPLLLNPMKPSIGLSIDETARVAAAVARGGMDLVKDDEVLADARFSPLRERVAAIRAALDATAEQTGRRARYFVSITARGSNLLRHADSAVEAGADGVMVTALGVGLDTLQTLVEHLDGRLPLIAHTAGIDVWGGAQGLGLAPQLLIRLCRLAGADAVLIGSPWARRQTPLPTWLEMAGELRRPWAGIPAAFPVVGGGVVADQLSGIVGHLGRDVIITAGGSVNGHADGAEAGARKLREALDIALAETAP